MESTRRQHGIPYKKKEEVLFACAPYTCIPLPCCLICNHLIGLCPSHCKDGRYRRVTLPSQKGYITVTGPNFINSIAVLCCFLRKCKLIMYKIKNCMWHKNRKHKRLSSNDALYLCRAAISFRSGSRVAYEGAPNPPVTHPHFIHIRDGSPLPQKS
jgi:hypothetical protein